MYEYNAKCTRVVDGDTLDAEIDLGFDVKVTKRIRLAGIDAPESRNKVEKKLGLAAKDRLIEIMDGAANEFELESQELGKYGRVLGRIHIDKISGKDQITKVCVNDALVREGHATEYDGGKR